jgi:hypothetical protein
MKNIKGWVSEKIFDCIRCGCVPIYWGATNINDYVHPGSFVDRRNFKSEKELIEYISSVTLEEWILFRKAGINYLKSDDFYKFMPENFASVIATNLGLDGNLK